MSSFCKFNEIGCTSRIRKRTIEVESPSRVFYPSSCGIKQVGGGIFGGEWTSISRLCAAPFSTGLFPFLSLSLSLSLAAVPLLHLPFFFSSQKSSKRQYQTRPIREAYFLFFFCISISRALASAFRPELPTGSRQTFADILLVTRG